MVSLFNTLLYQDNAPADTGKTALNEAEISARADGTGDINQVLTTLPNVSTGNDLNAKNEIGRDQGENSDDVLDLKPAAISISGALRTENAMISDGFNINSSHGVDGDIGGAGTPSRSLSRSGKYPRLYVVYGLSAQTEFLIDNEVKSLKVHDSNVSAKFGGFLGGVVEAEGHKPNLDKAEGKFSANFSSGDLTSYHLKTKDGGTPNDVDKPDWSKRNLYLRYNLPVTENTAVMLEVASLQAQADTPLEPQYGKRTVTSQSTSNNYELGVKHRFGNGDTVTVTGRYGDYKENYDAPGARNFHKDVVNETKLLSAEYVREYDALSFAGLNLSNAKLTLSGKYSQNESGNLTDTNKMYFWTGYSRRYNFTTTQLQDWCQASADLGEFSVGCDEGTWGSTKYNDDRLVLDAKLESQLGNGEFKAGVTLQSQKAGREGTGVEFYSLATHIGGRGVTATSFTCQPGDETCLSEQYFRYRLIQDAYKIEEQTNSIGAYVEADQTWGQFNLRGGLRYDYNDYMKKSDWSPRLVATWSPNENLAVSLGANRYFLSTSGLQYAMHDAFKRGSISFRRDTNGVVGDWGPSRDLGGYTYSPDGLKTPYNDELTLGVQYMDPWLGGQWRLRGIQRKGKDLFATEKVSSRERKLTNDGTSEYKSVTLEYTNQWETPNSRVLDGVGFNINATYSNSTRSNNNYVDEPSEPNSIWYKGQSYSAKSFSKLRDKEDNPLRLVLSLASSWLDGGIQAKLTGVMRMPYQGIVDTGTSYTDPADGRRYDLFEDHDFAASMRFNLATSFRIVDIKDNPLMLDVKVNNLLDDTGNAHTSNINPWARGRSIWVGTTYEF